MSPLNIYNPYIKAKMKYIISQNKHNTSTTPRYNLQSPPISMCMYYRYVLPFL